MLRLGFEPRSAEWLAQTDPLSYDTYLVDEVPQ